MYEKEKILITVVTILLEMGLLRIINNRKGKRGYQFPFLIITPIVILAETAGLLIYRDVLTQWLRGLAILQRVLQLVGLSMNHVIFYGMELLALNVLIAVPYLVLKGILLPIVTRIMKKNQRMRVAKSYIWDEECRTWQLKDDRIGVRKMLQGVVWITALITAAVSAAGWIAGPGSAFWFTAYPGAALVILFEYYSYYSGMTRAEYLKSTGGEKAFSYQRSSYSKLRRLYETLFPKSLLFSKAGKDFQSRTGSSQLLSELVKSPDRIDRFVGEYYRHLHHSRYGAFDVDLINATNKMLHHESTIIFDPFYQDVSEYMTLPLIDTLLSGKKCLVIVGRQSMQEQIHQWMQRMAAEYCHTDRLWQVSPLKELTDTSDIGVMAFSDLYNMRVINNSSDFLGRVAFVLLVEPSRMLSTSQAGLSIITGKFNKAEKPVFCALDHESDGLVDLLSHLFQQNVTSVVAAPAIQSMYSAMGWDAAGDFKRQSLLQQQTHFLGNGTELAIVALKQQVPRVDWFSAEKAPVLDIQWIAEQYHSQIANYTGLPLEQKSLEDHICFSSDLWGSRVTDHSFIIAEDETCNLFATMRAYLSRGKNQSFVHVLSENYLLRDYMRFNWQLFMSDAKAIPMLSPHYAKTERNTVMRLVILMASEPVSQKVIEQELQLLGYDSSDCYKTLCGLITRYTGIKDTIITVKNTVEESETLPVSIQTYAIMKRTFDLYFSDTLKNAFFVVEDEVLGSEYIDARMFGHIKQLVMPGQYIVYGGKLYKVHALSAQAGCILHRASDEYMSRKYYRQLRSYHLNEQQTDNIPGLSDGNGGVTSHRMVGDIEIVIRDGSFTVSSSGYLEMSDYGDLSTTKVVDLRKDPCYSLYNRSYSHKALMSIRFPGIDPAARYTLGLLLQELLHTLFPYSWPYLAVLCKKPEDADSALRQFTYDLEGCFEDDLIYILEDSDMDLGLLEAIDNNLFRILEILADYLNWHGEQKSASTVQPEEDVEIEAPLSAEHMKKKRKGLLDLFRKRKKKDPTKKEGEPKKPETPATTEETDGTGGNAQAEGEQTAPPAGEKDPGNDQDTGTPEPLYPSSMPYDKSCFLKFGQGGISSALDVEKLSQYLNGRGLGENSLRTARKGAEPQLGSMELGTEETCDFCGKPLNGVSYEELRDGRIRCQHCSATAINDPEEFKEVFYATVALMEDHFHITYNVPLRIRITDAKTLNHLAGRVFVPTRKFDGRCVGLAQHKGETYTMFVENGSPRLETIEVIAHEMTHIWQYLNWKDNREIKAIRKNRKERDLYYEGMASWAEIQILYVIGENAYAQEKERILLSRAKDPEDAYGNGFVRFCNKYGMGRQGNVPAKNPFNTFPPL